MPILPTRCFTFSSRFFATQTPTEGSHGSKLGSQAVIEYGKSANFNTADLQSFFKQLNPEQLGETCGVAYGDNNGDVRASVEANLDVQYIMATGQFVNTTTYKIAEPGVGIEDQMLDYTYIVGNQTQPALVHRYVMALPLVFAEEFSLSHIVGCITQYSCLKLYYSFGIFF